MNNDLISREALKKAIKEKLGIYIDGTLNNRLLFGIIDNAPSVETERPQGEWERHDEWRNGEYIGGFYHVNCPCEDGYYSKWETNFCPNCGAEMKGGAE